MLFEHGSLKEVVDHESSPCGCPPEPVVSVAEAGITSASPAAPKGTVVTSKPEEEHPFPVAISQGLAPQAAVSSAPSDAVHAQVVTTLNYDANAVPGSSSDKPASVTPTAPSSSGGQAVAGASDQTPANTSIASTAPAPVKAEAPLPPAAPSVPDLAHRIGRFFKRLFGKG